MTTSGKPSASCNGIGHPIGAVRRRLACTICLIATYTNFDG